MIRNLEVNQSKIIDLNKKKRLIAQRKARARRRFRTRVGMAAFVVALLVLPLHIIVILELGMMNL